METKSTITLRDLKDLDKILKENQEVSNKACESLKKNGKHIAKKIIKKEG